MRDCVDNIFFFNDTATTEIYTLSLHDALPISHRVRVPQHRRRRRRPRVARRPRRPEDERAAAAAGARPLPPPDRKSTRLNSSHANISYAVFCLKKKKTNSSSKHFYCNNYIYTY